MTWPDVYGAEVACYKQTAITNLKNKVWKTLDSISK